LASDAERREKIVPTDNASRPEGSLEQGISIGGLFPEEEGRKEESSKKLDFISGEIVENLPGANQPKRTRKRLSLETVS